MRILIANTQEFNPLIGGVEKVSVILTNEFKKLGHDVHFIACRKSSYTTEYISAANQIILSNPHEYNSIENIQEFNRALHKFQIDIIINQAGNIMEFSDLCFKASVNYKKAKIVSVIHMDPLYRYKQLLDSDSYFKSLLSLYKNIGRAILLPYRLFSVYKLEKLNHKFLYENSDAVVLLSDKFKKNYKKIAGSKNLRKLKSISNPIFFDEKNYFDANSKENIILYVGRIDYPQKRVDKLIIVWSKIEKDFKNWRLKIIGDGDFKAEIIRYCKKNKIPRIDFVGFSNPIPYYKKSKIICMTSSYEGFGMVLVEASYFGCVPIAFNSFSSLSDIIDEGVNGYMIDANNLSSYEFKLRSLMEDKASLNLMQKNSRLTYKKFQSKDIAKKWIDLFNALLIKRNSIL